MGAGVSGLLAYLFFALSTRSLGASAAAPVTVLWTYWSFSAAAVTFPLQHWIVRSVVAHGEGSVRRALPGVVVGVGAASIAAGLVAWAVREPLFGRADAWFPALVAGVTMGSGLTGIVRGSLSARGRSASVATALVLENGVRCLAAAVLIAWATPSALGLGICLSAGALAHLMWPSSFRLARRMTSQPAESRLWYLSGASAGQLMAQGVLTAGPVLLALSGGSAAQVTAVFAALALFRAPYTLAIGVVSQLTGRFTVLFLRGRTAARRRVWLAVVASTGAAAALGAGVGAWAGQRLLPVVFGEQVALPAAPAALLAAGSAVAVGSLVLAVMILAQGRGVAFARAWGLAVLAGGIVFTLLAEQPLMRVCWAFLATEVLALVALAVEERRGAPAGRNRPRASARVS